MHWPSSIDQAVMTNGCKAGLRGCAKYFISKLLRHIDFLTSYTKYSKRCTVYTQEMHLPSLLYLFCVTCVSNARYTCYCSVYHNNDHITLTSTLLFTPNSEAIWSQHLKPVSEASSWSSKNLPKKQESRASACLHGPYTSYTYSEGTQHLRHFDGLWPGSGWLPTWDSAPKSILAQSATKHIHQSTLQVPTPIII